MSPKRGQPPKPPDEKKQERVAIYLSPKDKEVVEEARQQEAPDRRIGAYARDVVIDHAEKVVKKRGKK